MKPIHMRRITKNLPLILGLTIFFAGSYFEQWWWIIGFVIGTAVLIEGWIRYSTMD